MKYILPLLLVTLLFGCVGANQHNNNNNTNEEENTSTEKKEEKQNNETVRFHNLHFRLGIDDVTVTGKAKTTKDKVFYRVEQGEEQIEEETKIELDKQEDEDDEWLEFETEFPLTEEMENSDDPLFIVFYGKNEQDKEINPNYMEIDLNLQYNK